MFLEHSQQESVCWQFIMLSYAHKKFPFLMWWQDISQWREREDAFFSKPWRSRTLYSVLIVIVSQTLPSDWAQPIWPLTSPESGQCNHSWLILIQTTQTLFQLFEKAIKEYACTIVLNNEILKYNYFGGFDIWALNRFSKYIDIDQRRSQRWKMIFETLQQLQN